MAEGVCRPAARGALTEASLRPLSTAMGRNFLLFGLMAVLLAGVSAAVMSRRGLRPLARFVSFMRTGAENDAYARFADGPAPAEIATLTDAYNRLISSLGSQHAQLERRTDELASANVALREEVAERERAESNCAKPRSSCAVSEAGSIARCGRCGHTLHNRCSHQVSAFLPEYRRMTALRRTGEFNRQPSAASALGASARVHRKRCCSPISVSDQRRPRRRELLRLSSVGRRAAHSPDSICAHHGGWRADRAGVMNLV